MRTFWALAFVASVGFGVKLLVFACTGGDDVPRLNAARVAVIDFWMYGASLSARLGLTSKFCTASGLIALCATAVTASGASETPGHTRFRMPGLENTMIATATTMEM